MEKMNNLKKLEIHFMSHAVQSFQIANQKSAAGKSVIARIKCITKVFESFSEN